MEDIYTRTEALLGEGTEKLKRSSVAVFGCGGVGSYVAEALARAGVGSLTVIDGDVVAPSNLNRQLIATVDTVGLPKAEVQAKRISSINPACRVTALVLFYDAASADKIDLAGFDYVCDAIDCVTSKLILAERCAATEVKLISSMGTGNKLDPSRFEVADISKTSVCPLARVMRRELKARGIYHLKVVYSKEEPRVPSIGETSNGKRIPASISFVPGAAGLVIAGEIIRDLAEVEL
ncbi:MAG: tRNA threonylcarbamoyladenosine dehydratase [Clostridia bacterium]|nr:tRNA threonylcarbamoyladenosine dehydratase [Clostridia bacterium]